MKSNRTIKIILYTLVFLAALMILITLLGLLIPPIGLLFEGSIEREAYKIYYFNMIIAALAIIAAAVSIDISTRSATIRVIFKNDYGNIIETKNSPLHLVFDSYRQVALPGDKEEDWHIYLKNDGNKMSGKIRVKISITNVLFDQYLTRHNYILGTPDRFENEYETISFDVCDEMLRGEEISVKDIPFKYAHCDPDILRAEGESILQIFIYDEGQKPMCITEHVKLTYIEESRLTLSDEEIECQEIMNLEHSFEEWLELNLYKDISKEVDYVRYETTVNPYMLRSDYRDDETQQLYSYYKLHDLDKMIFWGRMYYKSIGLTSGEIENAVQTDIMSRAMKGELDSNGYTYHRKWI